MRSPKYSLALYPRHRSLLTWPYQCAACIKAKRRCDLRQPSCLRCSQRKIECSYHAPPERPSKKRGDTAFPQMGMSPIEELLPWEPNFDFSMDLGSPYSPSCSAFPSISFDEPSLQGLEFLDVAVSTDSALDLIPPPPAPALEPEDPLPVVVRVPKPQIPGLSRIQLLRMASELIEKRLRYSMDAFKRAPEAMVLEGGTPWCHPALYRDAMPACLEDALGACALHRSKNAVNAAVIERVIEQRYEKLAASPIPTESVTEAMARTHALILYLIMLLFGDSCTAGALSDEATAALGDSAVALLAFARNDDEEDDDDVDNNDNGGARRASRNIPLYPLTAARALYADWTFQESLRRTLLVSFLLPQLQCLMRANFSSFASPALGPTVTQLSHCTPTAHGGGGSGSGGGDSGDDAALAALQQALRQPPAVAGDAARYHARPRLVQGRRLTLSAHLWHARDPVAFAVAWRDRPHLVARPWNIWARIDAAGPDDIDELGRMLMTSGMGIEETRAWFASKGGEL
ncbi:hypothetical protein F4802DRAFT_620391 [Xylaria palmicola]|nr:hypothetical protein F4802DRAFT_620391 [Xylaria palmicola]